MKNYLIIAVLIALLVLATGCAEEKTQRTANEFSASIDVVAPNDTVQQDTAGAQETGAAATEPVTG